MAFRIGRNRAQHTYPQPRFTGLIGPFARNAAVGPTTQTPVAQAGTQVPWALIESGAPSGVNVPVTPEETGILKITGVITLTNTSEATAVAQVQVQLNSGGDLSNAQATIDVGGFEAIPFMLFTTPQAVGVTTDVEVKVLTPGFSDGTIAIISSSSWVSVEEVRVATG